MTTVATAANAPADLKPPAVRLEPDDNSPVKKISSDELNALGQNLSHLFTQYVSDRRIAELAWLRAQRQYLGVYDPEIDKELSPNRSRVYPRLTRIKVISVLSRVMQMMFPGNDKNWQLKASPSPNMDPADLKQAVMDAMARDQAAGIQPNVDKAYALSALQVLADQRSDQLTKLLEDQLEEIGGDQSMDYLSLNRAALKSGIVYGPGLLRGPFVREVETTSWQVDPVSRQPMPMPKTKYLPQFEFLSVWDWYPDMAAKTLGTMDGYFERKVMSRSQLRGLANRSDFFPDQIKGYIKKNRHGNYRAQPFETELRAMGVKVNVNEAKPETMKYEVIVWHGPVSGHYLQMAGVEVPEDKIADDIDAEVWLLDGNVIKADMNPWRKLGEDVKTLHVFLFDEDDTSPVGRGLPAIMRDSQMAVCAAARMLMDNASIVCGPNLEINTTLLRPDQDLVSQQAYRNWYRDDDGITAQWPAVRNVEVNAHLNELQQIIDLWLRFADQETFVGPATGGDMERGPSEPMRTATGASMLRGDAALPFKDIIRSFDRFTQSIILSMVQFNRKFNPDLAPEGDYNVVARGASSLMAKEVRGMQVDMLAQTLTPEEKAEIDARKFARERFRVRDLDDLLISDEESQRRATQNQQAVAKQADQQERMVEAQIAKLRAEEYKNMTQSQKNSAAADAEQIATAVEILDKGAEHFGGGLTENGDQQQAGADQSPQGAGGSKRDVRNSGGPPVS